MTLYLQVLVSKIKTVGIYALKESGVLKFYIWPKICQVFLKL